MREGEREREREERERFRGEQTEKAKINKDGKIVFLCEKLPLIHFF